MIKAGIIGAAGYTGGEMIRLLVNHPTVDLVFAHSQSQAGKLFSSVHQDLFYLKENRFTDQIDSVADVLFLCMGHGESRKYLELNDVSVETRIIDLSHDFRLASDTNPLQKSFVFGLPEINKSKIINSFRIANPGCFATGMMLGLLPIFERGFENPVYATGITGSTGAGRQLSDSSHFSWRNNNIQAYKTLTHQHISEVSATLESANAASKADIRFVPWRGDFTRGIMLSLQFDTDLNVKELEQIYTDFYKNHPFTHLSREPIFLKQVVNTNHCLMQIEQQDSHTVVHVVLDNLLKGACGQALQNMNLMFGLDESTGLDLKAAYF